MGGANETGIIVRAWKLFPSVEVCEGDGFREGLNPSYGLYEQHCRTGWSKRGGAFLPGLEKAIPIGCLRRANEVAGHF